MLTHDSADSGARQALRRALLLGLALAVLAAAGACARRAPGAAPANAPQLAQRDFLLVFPVPDAAPVDESPLGVNAWMWQASLETLAFAPLVATDPRGGVISTAWYSDRAEPNERFRLTVFIQGQNLRADGVRVAVLRQARAERDGPWQSVDSDREVRIKIENAILTRARELRIAALARQ